MSSKPKRTNTTAAPAPAPRREPTKRELAAGLEAVERVRSRSKRVQVVGDPDKPGQAQSPHSDVSMFSMALIDALGTTSEDFTDYATKQLSAALFREGVDPIESLNAGLAIVAGIQPENEVEAMLAVQMAATHDAAMSMLRIARKEATADAIEIVGGFAVKLLRTYTAQIEALAKLRRKGEQTVRVEHVHVHSGGKAIVGAVNHQPGGGGGAIGNSDQPRELAGPEAFALAPGAPLWSKEPSWDAVPGTGGERQETVLEARRRARKRRA